MKRVIVIISLLFILINVNFVLATDLDLTVSDINPSSVGANEDFTVGIQILNSGYEDAEDINLEVKYLGEDILLKENQALALGNLRKDGGLKNIVYNFHTSPDVIAGERIIQLELSWKQEGGDVIFSNDYDFNVSIISDEPKLTIAGIKSKPERVVKNQDMVLTIRVENYGEGIAKNVRVVLEDLDFDGSKEAYLGEIEPHEDLPARFVLKSGKAGSYDYTVRVLYEFSNKEKERHFQLDLTIFRQSRNFLLIILSLVLIAIFFLIYVQFKKRKKKM